MVLVILKLKYLSFLCEVEIIISKSYTKKNPVKKLTIPHNVYFAYIMAVQIKIILPHKINSHTCNFKKKKSHTCVIDLWNNFISLNKHRIMPNVPRVSEAPIPRLQHLTCVHRVNLVHEKKS
jgi:hypothetical protein